MDKEIFGIRIKAWLVALAIFVLFILVCIGAVFVPNIIFTIYLIVVLAFMLFWIVDIINSSME